VYTLDYRYGLSLHGSTSNAWSVDEVRRRRDFEAGFGVSCELVPGREAVAGAAALSA
jgi:hypothetical protein